MLGVVSATRELADPMGLCRRIVGDLGPTGRLSSRDPQSSEACGYIAAGLKRSHVSLAELSDEQCCLVDFIYRRLWVSDRRCALA